MFCWEMDSENNARCFSPKDLVGFQRLSIGIRLPEVASHVKRQRRTKRRLRTYNPNRYPGDRAHPARCLVSSHSQGSLQ